MKHKRIWNGALVGAAVLAAATLISTPASAHSSGMGQAASGGHMAQGGHGMGYGMGHGMMGPGTGAGQGMMGHPGMAGRRGMTGCGPGVASGATVDRNLSVEDVTKILEGRLAWRGNDRLKVGKVVEKDDKTIIAEIVTVDNSLVQKLEFDRGTGRHRPVR